MMLLPSVIGHRGAAAAAPENTLESIQQAACQGVRWVEFDVQLTQDGQVIVFHDDDLQRTTNGQGKIWESSYAAIRKLDAGRWFAENWRGAKVPTLAEAIFLLLNLDLKANIEIKIPEHFAEGHPYIEKTVFNTISLLKEYWPKKHPLLLSSFSFPALELAYQIAPEFERGLLLWGKPQDWQQQARAIRAKTINCADQFITKEWISEIRQMGYESAIYTINQVRRARELLEWGANSLFTDCPAMIIGGVKSMTSVGDYPPGVLKKPR